MRTLGTRGLVWLDFLFSSEGDDNQSSLYSSSCDLRFMPFILCSCMIPLHSTSAVELFSRAPPNHTMHCIWFLILEVNQELDLTARESLDPHVHSSNPSAGLAQFFLRFRGSNCPILPPISIFAPPPQPSPPFLPPFYPRPPPPRSTSGNNKSALDFHFECT